MYFHFWFYFSDLHYNYHFFHYFEYIYIFLKENIITSFDKNFDNSKVNQ